MLETHLSVQSGVPRPPARHGLDTLSQPVAKLTSVQVQQPDAEDAIDDALSHGCFTKRTAYENLGADAEEASKADDDAAQKRYELGSWEPAARDAGPSKRCRHTAERRFSLSYRTRRRARPFSLRWRAPVSQLGMTKPFGRAAW